MESNTKFNFILVQGRALPQTQDSIQYFPHNWKLEFPIINKIGFKGIEWIYDKLSEKNNPVLTDSGIQEIKKESQTNKVILENIVLDWFLTEPLFVNDSGLNKTSVSNLCKIIDQSCKAGFNRIILPLLEKNHVSTELRKEMFNTVFKKISHSLESNNVELDLETSLPPHEEKLLLDKLNHEKVRICFDMGNSASFGYSPTEVIRTIGNFIGSVHIKDRKLNGHSVPLGQGVVNFHEVFKNLKKIGFMGPYSFQVFRDKTSNDVFLLEKNLTFINDILNDL